jgi:hypothetical protein
MSGYRFMKSEPKQNEAIEVIYLKAKYEGSIPAKLIGKGKIKFADGIIYFEGKKRLPLWLSVLLVFGPPNVFSNVMAHYGPASWQWGLSDVLSVFIFLLMIAVIVIARLKESGALRDDAVKAVIEDKSKKRFVLLADTKKRLPTCVAWQTTSDAAALSKTFGERFPSLLRNEDIDGSKTI